MRKIRTLLNPKKAFPIVYNLTYRNLMRLSPNTTLRINSFLANFLPKWNSRNPFEIFWIRSDNIKFESTRSAPVIYGEVKGGNWDIDQRKPIEMNEVYRGLSAYLLQGDASIYDAYETNSMHRDLHPVIDGQIPAVDQLVQSLQSHGFQLSDDFLTCGRNSHTVPPHLDLPTVDVGRKNDLIWRKRGRHRLFIAKILDITPIPVVIGRRHSESSLNTVTTSKKAD